jgi:hypothetical protein
MEALVSDIGGALFPRVVLGSFIACWLRRVDTTRQVLLTRDGSGVRGCGGRGCARWGGPSVYMLLRESTMCGCVGVWMPVTGMIPEGPVHSHADNPSEL